MTKWKDKRKVVGNDNVEKRGLAKPMIELIISYQKKLQDKEDNNKRRKPKKISFVFASLELSRRIDK